MFCLVVRKRGTGNLVSDSGEGITGIEWNVYGILQDVLYGKQRSSFQKPNFARGLIQTLKEAATTPSTIKKP